MHVSASSALRSVRSALRALPAYVRKYSSAGQTPSPNISPFPKIFTGPSLTAHWLCARALVDRA